MKFFEVTYEDGESQVFDTFADAIEEIERCENATLHIPQVSSGYMDALDEMFEDWEGVE